MAADISAYNILDGVLGEINREASFADIPVDVRNENYRFSNFPKEMEAYADSLEDIEKTWGEVPSFMKIFPIEVLVHEWASWKRVGEIDIERARYLLSTDEVLEEMLNKLKK